MMTQYPTPAPARFPSGEILYSRAAREALHQADVSGLVLLYRHLTGDWGDDPDLAAANRQAVAEDNDGPVVSRYELDTGARVVITTMYVHTPQLRWTDICLADEVIDDEAIDGTDEFDLLAEAAMVMADPAHAG